MLAIFLNLIAHNRKFVHTCVSLHVPQKPDLFICNLEFICGVNIFMYYLRHCLSDIKRGAQPSTNCMRIASKTIHLYLLCHFVYERTFNIDVVKPWKSTCVLSSLIKPNFHLATLFARREAKTRIRQCDWLKLAGEKIRREQVGTVPTFLSVRANKVAK